MAKEESVTITETAADGTETTIEITTFGSDDAGNVGEDRSLVEEIVEALPDVEGEEEINAAELAEEEIYDPAAGNDLENAEADQGDGTFHRGDYTDIGTGSDGETTYVIGEDFSYID